MRAPFTNTGHLPRSPDRLGVQFFLYTRQHGPRTRTRLDLNWPNQRLAEVIDVRKDTRVIVHGYLDDGNQLWIRNMVEALLERADQNVLVVDWGRGARFVNYLQVAADARLMGRIVKGMLDKWTQIGALPSSFHLIGASLGAHIAGYVGTRLPGIGRITGLDPAGPGFEYTAPDVRLDPADAIFVDVIHTNAVPILEMGFGYIQPCGTVDFYPNKGRHQPGCHSNLLDQLMGILGGQNVRKAMGCSHVRAIDYFIDSISGQCPIIASPCSFPHVMSRRHDCTRSPGCPHCLTMGYDVDLNASDVYYARTGSQAPFCQP